MRKDKTADVYAILKKKKSYYYLEQRYSKDIPQIVNIKTAKLLKETGLFEFERIVNENQETHRERQEKIEEN